PNFLRPAGVGSGSADALSEPRDSAVEPRKLIIGESITLCGEINSCDQLFVEGNVEAKLQTCRSMVIGETGTFNGTAAIDNVEVRGRYDGDLVVRKRLTIRSTGQAAGTISYREIEIEPGGKISGNIQATGNDQRPKELNGADL